MQRTNDVQGRLFHAETQRAAIILALTAVARILVAHHALAAFGTPWFFLRGTEMGYLAQSILEGKGLSSPFGVPTGPTAIICPGYPLIVAAIFRAFGAYSTAAATMLIALNIASNVLCAWWILVLGRRFSATRGAECAATFYALSPPLLWMPTIFWDTNFSAAVVLGAIVFSTRKRRPGRLLLWFYLGAACGLAGLLNPSLLPCLLTVLGFSALRGKNRWSKLSWLVVGTLLLFAPWPIRNAKVFHAWIPTRTTMGLELWMGNQPDADGFLDRSRFPTYNLKELAMYEQGGELAFMQQKRILALEYVRSSPLDFALLTMSRMVRFWTGTGNRPRVWAYLIHACVTSTLGVCGLMLLKRRGMSNALLSFCTAFAIFPLPYYITHAEFRYRLVVDPLLIALTALPIQAGLAYAKRRTGVEIQPIV